MSKKDWLINIKNSAAVVADALGYKIVDFILRKYNARSIDELSPAYYETVFSELYYYEVEIND